MSYLGIRGFESILRGGIPQRAGILLLTPEGSPRYLLGAHFVLEGLRRGERAVVVLSGESPDAFLARLARMGIDPSTALASGALTVVDWHTGWVQPVEGVSEVQRTVRASRRIEDLLAAVERAGAALATTPDRRAFVDVIPLALKGYEEAAVVEAVQVLRTKFAEFGATTIFAADRGMPDARVDPLANEMHAVLDARAEGGDVYGFSVLRVGGVPLAPRSRRVRVREDGAALLGESTVRTFSCPICDARVPFDATECPSCRTPRAQMGLRTSQPGLMNYLESLGRDGTPERAPREPRPPGRTNGSRPGPANGRPTGRVNGLQPSGRVNGLAPAGRTNGLRSPGRTNGLVNGLRDARAGITNGLTNGSGFTNGLGSARGRFDSRRSRWKLLLVPVLAGALAISPLLFAEGPGDPQFRVDGDFSDWSGVRGYAQDPSPDANASVRITGYKVVLEAGALFLYVTVAGNWFDDPARVHTLYAFVDRDRDPTTGYSVRGLGADLLVSVEGADHAVTASIVRSFPAGVSDRYNWTAWRSAGSASAVVSGSELETSISWGEAGEPSILLLADDGHTHSYSTVAFGVEPGALRASIRGRSSLVSAGSPDVLAIDMEAFGGEVNVSDVIVSVSGGATALRPQNLPIKISDGTNRSLTVRLDMTGVASGALLVAEVEGIVADRPVLIVGGPVRVYADFPPAGKTIDGWFDDWTGPEITPDSDPESVDADRDIKGFSAAESGSALLLYVDVRGAMLAGTSAPVRREVSAGGEGQASAPGVPSRLSGEDLLRIYVDLDRDSTTGVPLLGLRGADLLLEVRGIDGIITERRAFDWRGSWSPISPPKAEKDDARLEASVDIPPPGAIEIVFQMVGWQGPADVTEAAGTRGVRAAHDGTFHSSGRFVSKFSAADVEVVAGSAGVGWTLPHPPSGGTWSSSPSPVGMRYVSPGAEIRYTVSRAQVKEEFVLAAQVDVDALEFPLRLLGGATLWSEEGRPLAILVGSAQAFEFARPFAVDARGVVTPLELMYDEERQALRILLPTTLLESAAYPLVVDPIINYTLENDGPADDPQEWLGHSVAVGDFNGDGYADVLAGAPNNNKHNPGLTTGHGYAYIFYGPFSANDDTPDVWINPMLYANGTRFGYAVAAGNFNGDQYSDALISRLAVDGFSIGNTTIYYGSAGWSGEETTPDVEFVPPNAPKNFGISVAAGNLDNANYDDVLIGETGRDVDGDTTQDGVVYVYKSPFDALETSADYRLLPSSNAGGNLGRSLAVGRIDSDPYADVVVGEPLFSSQSGRVQFYKGIGLASGSGDRSPNATISSPSGGGNTVQFGASVSVGRMNGDAYADVLIGAPVWGSGDDGRAYVFLANSDGSGLTTGASPAVTLAGSSGGEQFGNSVLIADFGNDGTADALVGAWFYPSGPGTARGRVYWFNNPLADQTADDTVTGDANVERLGVSLAAGKFSNDARTVLAIGAYLWDGPGDTDSGRVVVADIPEGAIVLLVGAALIPFLRRRNRMVRPLIMRNPRPASDPVTVK